MAKLQQPVVPIVFTDDDLPYEEEILRNPYSVKHWLRYIEHKKHSPKQAVNMIYERALKELPGSYKLWYNYLRTRRQQVKGRCVTDGAFEEVNNVFERALVFMHKMPRIWMDYCKLLTDQWLVTRTRQAFDRALRSLPVTQHHRIWPLYLDFVRRHDIPETAVRVYRRYLKLCPEHAEDYIEYLTGAGRLDEAATVLARLVNDDQFVSQHGKSTHQLWTELCELMSRHPQRVRSLNVDAIIRGGLRRYTDQLGRLWTALADYYVRAGLFERARDVFEEAVQTVATVRDFTQVFDAYAQFEELSLGRRMEQVAARGAAASTDDDVDLELRLARLERLMERRPLLLNSVLLRQNPHNVAEWHRRVSLYEGRPLDVVRTYTEAVQTVQPRLAVGKLHTLWVAFAKFYEANAQLDDARLVLERAVPVAWARADDLAAVWCERAELELRHGDHEQALRLLRQATAPPPRSARDKDSKDGDDKATPTVVTAHKSLRVWSLLADMEESFGTFQSCKAVYERVLELRIATPQIIINYGLFLEERGYHEDAFRAYERGVALFRWPHVRDVWATYLTKFLRRYGGTKLERARDLFEQCLDGCPAELALPLFLLYARLEEKHGLARHAMAVYERAASAVPADQMAAVYDVYVRRAADLYGVARTRQIYERAVAALPEAAARDMCLRFAELETRLGEVDRARAVYAHCAQMCDPRVTAHFWTAWRDFEVRHGNEDTVREMLRVKRSVQAAYNTQVNMMSAQMLQAAVGGGAGSAAADTDARDPSAADAMRQLEARAAAAASSIAFVRGETRRAAGDRVVNPDEIDLGDEDDDEQEDDTNKDDDGAADVADELPIEEQTVPSQVFGSLKPSAKTGASEPPE